MRTLQFTVTHALGISVFTSRIVETDFVTVSLSLQITYEVFFASSNSILAISSLTFACYLQNSAHSLTTKQQNKLTFEMYRKPTTTDTITHNISCHSNEQETSAINYLINRMNTYQLTLGKEAEEKAIIM
jgi:hypothetical protein